MLVVNKLSLNHIQSTLAHSATIERTASKRRSKNWCQVINVKNKQDFIGNYEKFCQEYQHGNKWILMINPEKDALCELSLQDEISTNRILKIDTRKVNINFEHLKQTLLRGNCAAVILSHEKFTQTELEKLTDYAQEGATKLIILKQNNQLH